MCRYLKLGKLLGLRRVCLPFIKTASSIEGTRPQAREKKERDTNYHVYHAVLFQLKFFSPRWVILIAPLSIRKLQETHCIICVIMQSHISLPS